MLELFVSHDEKSISAKVFQDCPKKIFKSFRSKLVKRKDAQCSGVEPTVQRFLAIGGFTRQSWLTVFLDQRKFS